MQGHKKEHTKNSLKSVYMHFAYGLYSIINNTELDNGLFSEYNNIIKLAYKVYLPSGISFDLY